jgi:hypothetical protein
LTRVTPSAPALGPGESFTSQTQEFLSPYDLPAKSTLWGFVMFRSDEATEVVISSGKQTKVLVGQLTGPRVSEFSWRNGSAEAEQLRVRGRAVASDRELIISGVRGTGRESWVIGFGLHGSPNETQDGRSVHEAVLAAFVMYDSP